MSLVLLPHPHVLPSGFGQWIAQRFGREPMLVVAADREELERQFREAGIPLTGFGTIAQLAASLQQNGAGSRMGTALWFYSGESAADQQAASALAASADSIVLIPEPGADVALRRPQLVQAFGKAGLWPDYGCDLSGIGV